MSSFETDDSNEGLINMIQKMLRHKSTPHHQHTEPAPLQPLKTGAERQVIVHHQPLVNKEQSLVYDALVETSDPVEFLSWVDITDATSDEVLVSFEDFLYRRNRAAWEAMTYIIGPCDEPKSIVERYIALDQCMVNLARLLPDQGASTASASPSPSPLPTLWRIWTYCMISIHALVDGKCIADQTIWLRGTDQNPPSWVNIRKKDMKWKLNPKHGIFAQSNISQDEVQRRRDVQMMVTLWHHLSVGWCQVTLGHGYKAEAVEHTLIYLLSRQTGPADLVRMLNRKEPSLHRLHFRKATATVSARVDGTSLQYHKKKPREASDYL